MTPAFSPVCTLGYHMPVLAPTGRVKLEPVLDRSHYGGSGKHIILPFSFVQNGKFLLSVSDFQPFQWEFDPLYIVNNVKRCQNSTRVQSVNSFSIHVGKDAQLPVWPFFRCVWCYDHLKIGQKPAFFQFWTLFQKIGQKTYFLQFWTLFQTNFDQIHDKQPLRDAPFGKFHNQNHHFSPKLGLDSIASPGNKAEFGYVKTMFFRAGLRGIWKNGLGFHQLLNEIKKKKNLQVLA